MKLGYHYHIPAILIDGKIKTFSQQGLFLDSLAQYFDEINCFFYSPSESQLKYIDYNIKSTNIHLLNIGPNKPVYYRTIVKNKYLEQIYNNDIILIRGPSPTLPGLIQKSKKTPIASLLVGDYRQGAIEVPQNKLRKLIIKLWTIFYELSQEKALSKCLVLVNNQLMYNKWKEKKYNTKLVSTSTLSKKMFFKRTDTCLSETKNVLYIGRYDQQKGIEDIANAVIFLIKKGYDLKFSIAGSGDSRDNIIQNITRSFKNNNILSLFQNYGFKPFGSELFEIYRSSDVFITASRVSEGFPRTIWEAFSQSLPVITTPVGGIPYHVENNKHVLFCESNNSKSISVALEKIINNSTFRKNLIHNGYELAQSNTLESSAKKMVFQLKKWVKK